MDPFVMSSERESFAERMLREIRDDLKELARAIRGHNGDIGLAAEVQIIKEWMHEVKKKHERQDQAKFVQSDVEQAKWKAYAIIGGAASGGVSLLIEIIRSIMGG